MHASYRCDSKQTCREFTRSIALSAMVCYGTASLRHRANFSRSTSWSNPVLRGQPVSRVHQPHRSKSSPRHSTRPTHSCHGHRRQDCEPGLADTDPRVPAAKQAPALRAGIGLSAPVREVPRLLVGLQRSHQRGRASMRDDETLRRGQTTTRVVGGPARQREHASGVDLRT